MKTLKLFCAVALVMLSSACGFHLKGYKPQASDMMLTEMYIKGINRYDDIATNVKQLAKAHDIKLNPAAEWGITISDEEIETWQASTTQSLTTREYSIRLHITLHIHHKDITYQPIYLAEETLFQDNANESSSKGNEQELIIAELRQELAESILRRVQYIFNNPPDCDCDEPEPITTE